nr:hypothetical protein [Pandoravirus massiliensis]
MPNDMASVDEAAPPGNATRKRPACEIASDDDGDAAFDQGFTIDGLSLTPEEFAAAVPPERRLIVTVNESTVRVALDIVEVYRWLRTNPDGGLCGPFGQLPVEQHQRDAIVARAERLLPKRQRVSQEARFDYAWHDQGDDLHYHDAPSGAYLRERVVAGDHEGVLYCLDALAPGDVDSADEARRLLVRVANASLTTMFERMVAHQEIGGRLGVGGLLSLVDDITDMRIPRIDILVPTCRAVARLVSRGDDAFCDTHVQDRRLGTHNDAAVHLDDNNTNTAAHDNIITDGNGAFEATKDRAFAAMARTIRRVYTTMCMRTARNPVIDDGNDDSDDDDDSDDGEDDVPPTEAGCISQPSYSTTVRAVFEATRVTPDVDCIKTAIDTSARDLLDYMLGVACLSSQDALALALHAVDIRCVHALCLIMHHCRSVLGQDEVGAIARAASAAPSPLDHALGVVVAVRLRDLAIRTNNSAVAPACPRRMRFADS